MIPLAVGEDGRFLSAADSAKLLAEGPVPERIRRAGARAVQVNTGAGCHLDAAMVARALEELSRADAGVGVTVAARRRKGYAGRAGCPP